MLVAGRAQAADEPQPGDEPSVSPHPIAAIAKANEDASGAPKDPLVPKFASGFILANGSAQSVPSALARSRFDDSLNTVIGVSAGGTPYERWEYLAYLVASVAADAVNGAGGSVAPEQITVQFKPVRDLALIAGYIRIPFSVGQSAVITSSMFPTRPEPTALFQSGADAGVIAVYEALEHRVRFKAGFFDGLSLRLTLPQHTTIGPVVSASTEVSPLGALQPLEADFGASPFRFAVGGGILYRDGTAYDPSGYRGLHLSDTRVAASLRVAFRGLYVQGEYLHSLRTDDLSFRSHLARGVYGEASYYVAVRRKIGLAPLTRAGWSVQDEGFFPLHDVTAEAGLALYPRGDLAQPGGLRFVLEYQSERRIEEAETAYGALASVMYRF